MKRLSLLFLVTAFTFACGDGGGTPTAPSVTAPTISTPNTSIYIGQSVTFAATGGGTIRWGGDAPAVATVDQSTGRITGIGTGRVTVWAENERGRTTRLLRGFPSFAGDWQGDYVTEGCTQSGIYVVINSCEALPNGRSRSMSLTFSQTEERVAAGSISFGLLTGPTTATTVGEDGQIRLSASLSPLPSVLIAVVNIVLSSPSKGNIQGSLEQAYSSPDVSGTLRVFSRVANLTRISGGPTLRRPATRNATTYGDLLRLMSQ